MTLRELERESIRAFVQSAADEGYLSGRVLDYGCGKQPYRDIVEAAGGEYEGFDSPTLPANVSGREHKIDWDSSWDAILCTQVLQYVVDYLSLVNGWPYWFGEGGGYLVLTYPTNWPEVEPEDLHRFTRAGMERLLTEAGFGIVRHEPRAVAAVTVDGENLYAGYGVVARA